MPRRSTTPVPEPPPKLVEALKEKRCALFVGAGLSQGAGLPGWKELLEEMIARSGEELSTKRKSEMRKLLRLGKYLDVAQELSDILTRPEFLKALVDLLKPIETNARLTEAHKELPQIKFSLAITTNYDRLLERAYSAALGGDTPPL